MIEQLWIRSQQRFLQKTSQLGTQKRRRLTNEEQAERRLSLAVRSVERALKEEAKLLRKAERQSKHSYRRLVHKRQAWFRRNMTMEELLRGPPSDLHFNSK